MNSETVDLIYADPPFNSNKNYAAPVGSKAAGAAFKDAWALSDIDSIEHNRLQSENKRLFGAIAAAKHTHSKGMFSYLVMMALRLLEVRRILKPTESIYLHCDPFAGCATSLIAAQAEGREWGGINQSEKAVELVKHRIRDLTAVPIGIHARVDIPLRTDVGQVRSS